MLPSTKEAVNVAELFLQTVVLVAAISLSTTAGLFTVTVTVFWFVLVQVTPLAVCETRAVTVYSLVAVAWFASAVGASVAWAPVMGFMPSAVHVYVTVVFSVGAGVAEAISVAYEPWQMVVLPEIVGCVTVGFSTVTLTDFATMTVQTVLLVFTVAVTSTV